MEPKSSGWSKFIEQIRQNITIEKIVVRMAMSWILTAILFFVESGSDFDSAQFLAGISFPMYLCFVVLFFVFFCGLAYFKVFTWIETYGPMILLTVYGFLTLQNKTDLSYILGIGLMLGIAITYATFKTTVFLEIKYNIVVIVFYVIAAAVFVAYFGCIAAFRYLTYRSPGYDFGIWAQMFYYMKNTFAPLTTCERSELLSHFAIHFSPIYYVLLPFYLIFPTPVTINVLQVVVIASGLIPMYKLCVQKNLSLSARALFAMLFVLLPAMGCGTFYDLHENCFLVPLMLWMFYFIEKNDLKFILLFAFLTCLVKEDAPMYVACIGLYMMLSKKEVKRGSIVMVGGIVYFAIVLVMMELFGAGAMDSRFSNYMTSPNANGMWDLIRTIIANPAYVLSECFSEDRMAFLAQTFLPIGFMPLATKHMSRFVLFIPIVLENLASDWKYQHSVFFQYAFGTCAILLYLAVLNYSELSERARRFIASVSICMSILFLPMCALTKSFYFDIYPSYRTEYVTLNQMVDSIPQEASVTCSAFFVAHLAERDVIYETGYVDSFTTDYVIIDLRWSALSAADKLKLENGGYRLTREVKNMYGVYEKE